MALAMGAITSATVGIEKLQPEDLAGAQQLNELRSGDAVDLGNQESLNGPTSNELFSLRSW